MNTATSIKDIGIANLADYFASGWNTRNIGGFIFDEQFQIEGIPLSWFLKRLLFLHTIPPQLQVKPKIEKMLNGESVTYTAKDRLRTKVLTKLFFTNENIKLMGGRKIRTAQPSSRHPLLFLTYLEHLNQQTGEIYRLQNLLQCLQVNISLWKSVLFLKRAVLLKIYKGKTGKKKPRKRWFTWI